MHYIVEKVDLTLKGTQESIDKLLVKMKKENNKSGKFFELLLKQMEIKKDDSNEVSFLYNFDAINDDFIRCNDVIDKNDGDDYSYYNDNYPGYIEHYDTSYYVFGWDKLIKLLHSVSGGFQITIIAYLIAYDKNNGEVYEFSLNLDSEKNWKSLDCTIEAFEGSDIDIEW